MNTKELREDFTRIKTFYDIFDKAQTVSNAAHTEVSDTEVKIAKRELLISILNMKKKVKSVEDSLV